jgi:two-component system sensor histidine kinase/response regulator
VLVVDDNEVNRIVAGELLGDVAGAVVAVVDSGMAAIERLAHDPFDVVLMDLRMPVPDGYATTSRLRGDPRHAGLPIVAMTAHATAEHRGWCAEAGMDDFISKPFLAEELFRVLASFSKRRRAAAAAAAPSAAQAVASPDAPAAPPTQRPRVPAPSVLDDAAALALCMGRADLLARVRRQFADSHAHDAQRMRAALAAGDARTLAELAHRLAGSAGSVGAVALTERARSLDRRACTEGVDDGLQAQGLETAAMLEEVLAALAIDLGQPQPSGG